MRGRFQRLVVQAHCLQSRHLRFPPAPQVLSRSVPGRASAMGFFSGRVTCTRFRVAGRTPGSFGPQPPDQLAAHAIGKQKVAAADGSLAGWTAGDHILDTRFDLAKNIVNDTLHFALRIDAQKMPGDLLRAYYQTELDALAAANSSGRPSARQKREAREAARERLEAEAADGRYLRRKAYP